MGLFATGVTIVAARTADGIVAMTANAVSSVSLDPPLVLVCVDHRARLAGHLAVGLPFSINLLRDEQEVLSRYFGGGWLDHPAPEFHFDVWDAAPRLIGALAAIRCDVDRLDDGGDHHILVGAVRSLVEGPDPWNPLLFYGGRYRRLAPPTVPAAPPEEWAPDGVSIYYDEWGPPEREAQASDPPE